MASLFDLLHGLTKVEVVGPDGNPQFYNPPEQNAEECPGVPRRSAKTERAGSRTESPIPIMSSCRTESSAAIPPELQAIFSGQPQAQSGTPGSESISQQDNQHPLSFLRPNFQQASSDAVGLPNAKSPALTTKGKTLLTLLQGGLGALAGSDQRTAAGGYRAAVEEPSTASRAEAGSGARRAGEPGARSPGADAALGAGSEDRGFAESEC
jgi:hypothetical protein